MAIPLARQPVGVQRYIEESDGSPLSLGYLLYFLEGSSTPEDVEADADGSVSLGTRVDLDANGMATSVFFHPLGYRLEVYNAQNVLQAGQSCDTLEDVGAAFASNQGTFFAAGTKDASSGYTATNDDFLITTDANDTTNPFILNLQPSAERTQPLTIKHQSAFALAVTPDGTETIEAVAAAYSVPAAASPNLPTVTLLPVTNGYLISSSHGI